MSRRPPLRLSAAACAAALVAAAAAAAAPARAEMLANESEAVAAYTCFLVYNAALSEARSTAARRVPAEAARRLSRHINGLDLDRAAEDSALEAARARWLSAPDDPALRRSCDAVVDSLPRQR